MLLNSKNVIQDSGIQFGTSGARGLVEQFTSNVCAAFTHAFITTMKSNFSFKQVAIAIDNRPSSPLMAQAVAQALADVDIEAVYYGVIPTPALAYTAMQDNIPCIMVTGSHIPFDRNGLKFYRPDGEISKSDEEAILCATVDFEAITDLPELAVNVKAATQYVERYTTLFDNHLLTGKRIGIYEHSSSGRDIYQGLFESLGAEVISLERTDKFVPIDTEAVAESDKEKARRWSKQHNLDFIFSTDGDGDRPLVADECGEWLRGDILGLLCAQNMGIEAIAVPVSCNSAIEMCSYFKGVSRTKIGSPWVIAEFGHLASKYNTVAGFEANGGFLLGSDIEFNGHVLKALPTRDALLPALMLLEKSRSTTISRLVNSLPQRYTDSDRIQNYPTENSLKIIQYGIRESNKLMVMLGFEGMTVNHVDNTDGLRVRLSNSDIIHLRPSGNAPELRCYSESSLAENAAINVQRVLGSIVKINTQTL